MSDEMRVMEYLLENKSATVKEISDYVGTTECRKYISNLIRKGFPIKKERIKRKNRFGEERNIVRYVYEEHLAG